MKLSDEEWSSLNNKLYRGFKAAGKQVPKLSAKEAEWLFKYLDYVSSKFSVTNFEFPKEEKKP